MRISGGSSDVCSSDLRVAEEDQGDRLRGAVRQPVVGTGGVLQVRVRNDPGSADVAGRQRLAALVAARAAGQQELPRHSRGSEDSGRTGEGRGGKEWVRPGRSRWARCHTQKKEK